VALKLGKDAYFRMTGSAGTAGIASDSDRSFFLLSERNSEASLPTAREILLPLYGIKRTLEYR
jgi:hypothetical protein